MRAALFLSLPLVGEGRDGGIHLSRNRPADPFPKRGSEAAAAGADAVGGQAFRLR